MKLLKGYRPQNKASVEYPYKGVALHMWWDTKKLEGWMPYTNYSSYYIVEIGEVVWDETTQNI